MDAAQKMVREFHELTGQPVRETPSLFAYPKELRVELLMEEVDEFAEALSLNDLPKAVDALGDILYLVYGSAVSMGVDLEPFIREIHRSNMTKTDGVVRGDGKILKGPNYSPPDIAGVLRALYGEEVDV
jgi:predicted HAD superfamily Cof-like phosphohydrolase